MVGDTGPYYTLSTEAETKDAAEASEAAAAAEQ